MNNPVYFVNHYMFRPYLGPSSGGTTYVYNNWYLLLFLDDCLLLWLDWNCSIRCIHKIVVQVRMYLLMMGLDTSETCRG